MHVEEPQAAVQEAPVALRTHPPVSLVVEVVVVEVVVVEVVVVVVYKLTVGQPVAEQQHKRETDVALVVQLMDDGARLHFPADIEGLYDRVPGPSVEQDVTVAGAVEAANCMVARLVSWAMESVLHGEVPHVDVQLAPEAPTNQPVGGMVGQPVALQQQRRRTEVVAPQEVAAEAK